MSSSTPMKKEVNVEAIMRQIRREVQMEEDARNMPSFESVPFRGSVQQAAADVAAANGEQTNWKEFMDSLLYVNAHYDIPYYWSFGPNSSIKAFAKRIVRKLNKCLIAPILGNQNFLNAHFVRCLNQVRYFVEYARAKLQSHQDEINAQRDEINAQRDEINAQRDEINAQRVRLEALEQQMREKDDSIQILRAELAAQSNIIQELREEISAHGTAIQDMRVEISAHGIIIPQLQQKDAQLEERLAPIEKTYNGDTYTAIDYFKFQNEFRGSFETIKERQKCYLPYFQGQTLPVVDIGCGRGEFLSLMRDNGIRAFGVDLYQEYATACKAHGLDVVQGDGIQFLQNTQEQLGGVFCSQVIEHITFADLQALCVAAYEKLAPGGCLVMETPNPMCLAIYASTFYLDPSHTKPVHPLLLKYVLESVGFSDVQLLFTRESALDPLARIRGDGISNLEEFNNGIARISNLVYATLDYAVIARK